MSGIGKWFTSHVGLAFRSEALMYKFNVVINLSGFGKLELCVCSELI